MLRNRKRPLVLTEECVRHPLRQRLPRRYFHEPVEIAPESASEIADARWLRGEDVQLFALSFFAFFTAFYLFIF